MPDHIPHSAELDARARLLAVDVAVADAENDLDIVLLQPKLFDPLDPASIHFASQREQVRQLVRSDANSWTARQGVDDLEVMWRSLREDAQREGLKGLGWRERVRVQRARRLLEQARSDRGSPAMRLRAYHRGLRTLNGLISLPETLRREISETAAHTEPLRVPGPDFPTYW